MEQKKALGISLSAGIFLLTVFGAALIISSKNAKNNVYAASLKGTDSIWVSTPPAKKQSYPTINVTENQQSSTPISGVYTPSVSDDEINAALSNNTTTDSEILHLQPAPVETQPQASQSNININESSNSQTSIKPAVTAQNETAEKAIAEAKTASATTAKQSSTSTQKPATTTKTTAKTTTTQNTATSTTKPAASKTTSTATTTQYWVQVSSYSTKKNADEARSVLDANNVPCEVFTYTDKSGTMYYRVRVGPYATKSEAEKGKTRVDSISMFKSAGSYVVSAKKEN